MESTLGECVRVGASNLRVRRAFRTLATDIRSLTHIRSSTTRACALFACATLLWACDVGPEPLTSVTFNGVTYNAIGQAELFVIESGLEVSNIGVSGGDGIRADVSDGELDSLGVVIMPLVLGTGSRWGLAVFGDVAGTRTPLASAWAEDIGGGRNSIQVAFASGLGLDSLTFEYLLGGVLVARSPTLPSSDGLTALVASAGTTDVGPHSVHAVREGGVVVVGTDYRGDSFTGGSQAIVGAGCTAALIQVSFQPDAVCADLVRAVPRSSSGLPVPPATSAEIDGRRIGEFVITGGALN